MLCVAVEEAAPKRTHLTQERTVPFLDCRRGSGKRAQLCCRPYYYHRQHDIMPGISCPVPCPAPGRSLRAGRTHLENKMGGALGKGKVPRYRVPFGYL